MYLQTCYVVQDDSELLTVLPLPPEGWNYGLVSPHPSSGSPFNIATWASSFLSSSPLPFLVWATSFQHSDWEIISKPDKNQSEKQLRLQCNPKNTMPLAFRYCFNLLSGEPVKLSGREACMRQVCVPLWWLLSNQPLF